MNPQPEKPGHDPSGPAARPPLTNRTDGLPDVGDGGAGFRSGFVTIVGRPNVGKSSLLNRILRHKVSITSRWAQTTRVSVHGVLDRPGVQLVFVDTPGIHKPVSALGERLNATAFGSLAGVDVVCLVIDATAPFGRGDRFVADRCPRGTVVILNKCDSISHAEIGVQLQSLTALDEQIGIDSYFPVSARTGKGVPALVDHLLAKMPPGPRYYPEGTVTDVPEAWWVAELVREELLAVVHDELPYSIATRVTEWEWPRVRVEIIVERDSQKGMVIGKGGAVLKEVGTRARHTLPSGVFLELAVVVDKDWQFHPDRIEHLGY